MAARHVNIATALLSVNVFLICAIWLTPVVAKKERLDHGVYLELSDLITNIEKRLNNPNFESHLLGSPQTPANGEYSERTSLAGKQREKSDDTCTNKVTEGSIIRATDSLNNGAEFLDSFKGTESNFKCQEYCCRNSSCDTAIYQDKGDRYCYLFHCEGKCRFKNHAGYLVNGISHTIVTPGSDESSNSDSEDISGNENDLENLSGGRTGDSGSAWNDGKSQGDSGDVESGETEKPSSSGGSQSGQAPASVEEESQGPVISQHSVSLSGYCTQDNQCEDTNAACSSNNCKCRPGFYDKEGLCRTSCPTSKFECFELGTITRGPECVPKAQVCDSYMQCADGSDEFNCEADFPSVPKHGKPKLDNKEIGQSSLSKPEGVKSKPKPMSQKKPPADPTKDPENFRHQSVNSNSLTKSKPSSPESSIGDKSILTTLKPVAGNNPHPSQKFETGNGGAKHLFVASREKVIIASPGGGNAEGPIVALSLGLALTLVLLVMVACRLRGFKHRLSKGRPLNQNEADYLINGMYL